MPEQPEQDQWLVNEFLGLAKLAAQEDWLLNHPYGSREWSATMDAHWKLAREMHYSTRFVGFDEFDRPFARTRDQALAYTGSTSLRKVCDKCKQEIPADKAIKFYTPGCHSYDYYHEECFPSHKERAL